MNRNDCTNWVPGSLFKTHTEKRGTYFQSNVPGKENLKLLNHHKIPNSKLPSTKGAIIFYREGGAVGV